jgi:hypothetical protein
MVTGTVGNNQNVGTEKNPEFRPLLKMKKVVSEKASAVDAVEVRP